MLTDLKRCLGLVEAISGLLGVGSELIVPGYDGREGRRCHMLFSGRIINFCGPDGCG